MLNTGSRIITAPRALTVKTPLMIQTLSYLRHGDMPTPLFPPYMSTTGSVWSYVVDAGLKNSEGKGARDVLMDIIEDFPKHDFEFQDGICKVAEDIRAKLSKVANFDELYPERRSMVWKDSDTVVRTSTSDMLSARRKGKGGR